MTADLGPDVGATADAASPGDDLFPEERSGTRLVIALAVILVLVAAFFLIAFPRVTAAPDADADVVEAAPVEQADISRQRPPGSGPALATLAFSVGGMGVLAVLATRQLRRRGSSGESDAANQAG